MVEPANATSDVADVETIFTPGEGWSEPAPCPWTCDSGYDHDTSSDTCIDEAEVPCNDVAPVNATSITVLETITYTDAGGWTSPADCAWECDVDYCRSGDACENAYVEHRYEQGSTSTWFGGDDRDGFEPRNLGGGQQVRLPGPMDMVSFAFKMTGPFQSSQDPQGGVEVTLRLDLRDTVGQILATSTVALPASFDGGWVWWDMTYSLLYNTDYVFTAFVMNGMAQGVKTNQVGDPDNGYANGFRHAALGGDDLSSWSYWVGDPEGTWDYQFRIRSQPACEQP